MGKRVYSFNKITHGNCKSCVRQRHISIMEQCTRNLPPRLYMCIVSSRTKSDERYWDTFFIVEVCEKCSLFLTLAIQGTPCDIYDIMVKPCALGRLHFTPTVWKHRCMFENMVYKNQSQSIDAIKIQSLIYSYKQTHISVKMVRTLP